MSEEERVPLLPCPFCGATGESQPLWGRASVLHPDGDCCLARHHVWLEQWNTRATPTRISEEDAFFEAALEYARKWHDPSRWCGERSLETNNRACDWDAMMAAYRALEARPK